MTAEEAITIIEKHGIKDNLGFTDENDLEAEEVAIKALETVIRLKELYHDFCGYDLSKCKKYGNETPKQQHDSYSTMMMYEIAMEFEDIFEGGE